MVYSSTIRIPRNNTQCKKLQLLDCRGNSKINSLTFRKQLCTITSMSSIENDSTATIQDSFKDCILTCKIEIKCMQTSRKEKFHKQSVVILLTSTVTLQQIFSNILFKAPVSTGDRKINQI